MCGVDSPCEKCADCTDEGVRYNAECKACWEPNAEMQAELMTRPFDGSPIDSKHAATLTCLGHPQGVDCGFCWTHHEPTKRHKEL